MSITTITLPNGITVETTDTVDLAALMATVPPMATQPKVSTPKAQAPKAQPRAQAPEPKARVAKPTQPKAQAKVDGKALMASIRQAQSAGDIQGACELAKDAGWDHVVESIMAKAGQAKPQAQQQAKPRRSTKSAKRATTTVAAVKAQDVDSSERTAPKVDLMSEPTARRVRKSKTDAGPMAQGLVPVAESKVAQAMVDGPDALVEVWVELTEQVEFLDISASEASAQGNERRATELTAQAALLAEVIATIPQPSAA